MPGTFTELADFLAQHDLLDLHDRFVAEDIDMALLPTLDASDLKELGLSIGQRKKLLIGLEALASRTPDAPNAETDDARSDPPVQLRRLSVMFCDMIGSTALGELLDIDEMQIVLQHYYDTADGVAKRHGGQVVASQGDGLVILFGYPRVLDGFAECCILAARDLQADLSDTQVKLVGRSPVTIKTRIGIATGQAAVGHDERDVSSDHMQLVGPVVNRAARLQTVAQPQSIAVDLKTHDLTTSSVQYSEAERHDLKGLPSGLEVFHVLGLQTSDDTATAPTKLIGREAQTGRLNALWTQAQNGAVALATISGSAGIGKTALIQDFVAGIGATDAHILRLRCASMAAQSPLRPVITALNAQIGQLDEDAVERALQSLLNHPPPQMLERVAQLLRLPGTRPEHVPISASDRDGVLTLLADWIINGDGRPTVLVVENAQWADDSTRELITRSAQRAQQARRPILMLEITRDESSDLWPEGAEAEILSLSSLETEAADQLLDRVLGYEIIPHSVRQNILYHGDGNPLMLETLGHALASDQLSEMAGAVEVPHTIYESVSKRLDTIQSGRRVIEAVAVLGTSTSRAALAALLNSTEPQLSPAIEALEQAGLITRERDQGGDQISIRHKVYRDVIYEQIAGAVRKALHLSAYHLLHKAETARQEVLATHAQAAQDWQLASGHALDAGDEFLKRSALVEAGHFFEMASDAFRRQETSYETNQKQLRAISGLASVERSRFGIATERSAQLGRDAAELAREIGDKPAELLALNGLYAHALVHADYKQAEGYAHALLETAEQCQNKTFVMIATRAIGAVALHRGDQHTAKRALGDAFEQYDEELHLPLAHAHGYDHAEICASLLSMSHWISGDLARAREFSAFSVAHSQKIDHLHSLAQAIAFRVMRDALARHGSDLSEDEADAIAAAEKLGILVMPAAAHLFPFATRLCVQPGAPSDADMAELAARTDRFRAVNPFNYGPLLATVLAEVHLRKGDIAAAQAVLEDGLRTEQNTGETWTSAEVLRLRACVALARGETEVAAQLRGEALERANQTHAATIALRIACDMIEQNHSPASVKRVEDALAQMSSDDLGWDMQRAQTMLQFDRSA